MYLDHRQPPIPLNPQPWPLCFFSQTLPIFLSTLRHAISALPKIKAVVITPNNNSRDIIRSKNWSPPLPSPPFETLFGGGGGYTEVRDGELFICNIVIRLSFLRRCRLLRLGAGHFTSFPLPSPDFFLAILPTIYIRQMLVPFFFHSPRFLCSGSIPAFSESRCWIFILKF